MMPKTADYIDQPFDLAIAFFRNKVKLPTERWDDLWKGMHSRAFVVAGAMKNELLEDLHAAVDKGIAQGTTLAQFRKDFDALVSKHGWSYKGGRKWRSAIIFNTNLSVAYSSGHYQSMQDVKKTRPYWRYVPSSSKEPRTDHMRWYNLILPADDPFWDTHYPPNDWGCKCGVTKHSGREVERLKQKYADGDYPVQEHAPEIKTYQWEDKAGRVHDIPEGIGPGWNYNPGQAAWGKQLAEKEMAFWKAQKRD
ncbi:MAG: phage minor head protein, partial [Planctomycetota bacterium]